jgi:hypothetical protein
MSSARTPRTWMGMRLRPADPPHPLEGVVASIFARPAA